eukprot:TRINITY_DN21200_c0_g1_i1.p1 TRINITY_DN21200_c0_g1~~TRINITY_DN21200_c0_g1_i1.p1  ORF type:complete len:383 (+),score=45.84 TRINITY_DN21200_c0_g1_i1:169-1149(+)
MSFSASPCLHAVSSPLSSPLHGFAPPPFQLLPAAPTPVPATALAPGTYLVNAHVPPSCGGAFLRPSDGRSLLNLLPHAPQGGSVAPVMHALEGTQPALRQRANTEPIQRAITEPPPGQEGDRFIRRAGTTELAAEAEQNTTRPRSSTAQFVNTSVAAQPRVSTTHFLSAGAAVQGVARPRLAPASLNMGCVTGYPATSCVASPTGFVTITSPASPVNVAAGSPTWTTVVARPRRVAASQHVTVRPAAQAQTALPEQASGLAGEGAAVDLFYDQKELFARGWSRDSKQSRSVKMKKRVDYQIDKRRQQSERDRAANMAFAFDEEDEW